MNEDLQDYVSKAMRKAFQLGQTYWAQADSEYFSQNKKFGVKKLIKKLKGYLCLLLVQRI